MRTMQDKIEKLEDMSLSILNEIAVQRSRQIDFKETTEYLIWKIFYIARCLLCCLFFVTVCQIVYFRYYLRKRKYIS